MHEALLRSWDRMRQVIRSNPEFKGWYRRISPALQRWSEERSEYELLRGPQLAEGEHWLALRPAWLRGTPAEFISASVEAAGEELARAERAERQAQLARSRYLAIRARDLLEDHFDAALLIAAEACRIEPTVEARVMLRTVLQHRPEIVAVFYHPAAVYFAAISPDLMHIGSIDTEGVRRIWDVANGRLESTDAAGAIWFDRGASNRLRVDPAAVGAEPASSLAAISPSIAWRLVSKDPDRTREHGFYLTLDGPNRVVVHKLGGEIAAMSDSRVSAAGRWAVGEGIGLCACLDPQGLVTDHQCRYEPSVAERCIAISPEGKLATGGESQVVTIRGEGADKLELRGHEGAVQTVAFSPEGSMLASGGTDGRMILWRHSPLTWPPLAQPVVGYEGLLAFVSHGRLLCVTPHETTVLDIGVGEAVSTIVHTGAPSSVHNAWDLCCVSANGRALAWVDADANEICVWDVEAGERARALPGGAATGLTLSADGRRLAVVENHTAIVWDLTGEPALRAEDVGGQSVALNFDGSRVAFRADHQLKVLDTLTGAILSSYDSPDRVTTLALSPDGTQLACGTDAGEVFLYNVDDGSAARLALPTGWPTAKNAKALFPREGSIQSGRTNWPVRCLAFSANGSMLGACGDHSAVALWEASSHQQFGDGLSGHPGWRMPDGGKHWCTRSVAFRDDEAVIATSAKALVHYRAAGRAEPEDTALLLWDMDPDSWRERARRVANHELSREEWTALVGPGEDPPPELGV